MKVLPRLSKFLIGFVLFMVLLYVGTNWFVHDQVESAVQEVVAGIPGVELRYSRLDVGFTEHTVTLNEVELIQGKKRIFADRVVFYHVDEKHTVPHSLKASATGVVLPADWTHLGSFAMVFNTLGLVELRGDCDVEYVYDSKKRELNLKRFHFNAADLGDLELGATFSNIDLDGFRPEKMVGLQVGDMDLAFADAGLMQHLNEGYAATRTMTPEEVRDFFASEISVLIRQAKKNKATIAADAFEGIRSYIETPEKLVVSARPEQPVPWLYFFMGRDVFESMKILNLTVENESVIENQ